MASRLGCRLSYQPHSPPVAGYPAYSCSEFGAIQNTDRSTSYSASLIGTSVCIEEEHARAFKRRNGSALVIDPRAWRTAITSSSVAQVLWRKADPPRRSS